MMAGAHFFAVASMSGMFLFPLFVTAHGGSEVDIGLLMGAMAMSAVASRPVVSWMIDRLGRRRSYGMGAMAMALTPLAYLLFDGPLGGFYLPLTAVRIAHGVGLAVSFTAAFTYIADIIPTARLNEGLGMFGTTALVAMAVGPALAEPVVSHYGFPLYFVLCSGLGAGALTLHLFLPETYSPPGSSATDLSFLAVLIRKKVWGVASLAGLFGVGLAAYGGFVAPLAQHRALPNIAFYFMAYSAAALMTRLLGSRLADRVGEERIIPWALFINGAGLLLLIPANGTGLLILSGLVTGTGHGFLFPCLNALVIRDEPPQVRGKINGIFTGGIDAGTLVGSVALGYVGEHLGFQALFLVAGLSVLSGLIFFRTVIQRH
ncbi:MAG: MFS transporter [Proteobacteria bacterium]|nr:MFS transporter [Pseudomonadota bacterium]